ncbi:ribosome recycling factor [Tepidibacillus decaturensis]|uniref:ribosome recycling factor n=2 Tax=Bacillaceae TaxID=186817 RepID=UPI001EFFB0AB|nr:ribosome recycling factor [Tepidibacillus decaturensis]
MEKAISTLKKELASVRAGRANVSLLDKVQVEYYGALTPLNQMANITTPDARTLVIQPWDKSIMGEIEKAILKSELGITPTNDGSVIRINIPPLTEERRKELVKVVKKMGEESKVAIRNIRRDANEELKKKEKNGEISEDQSHRTQEEIQKLTDKFIGDVDTVVNTKEKEIMEV